MPEAQGASHGASHRLSTFSGARKERKGQVDASWFGELLWVLKTVIRGRRLRPGISSGREEVSRISLAGIAEY